jgi:hypothetical protein
MACNINYNKGKLGKEGNLLWKQKIMPSQQGLPFNNTRIDLAWVWEINYPNDAIAGR